MYRLKKASPRIADDAKILLHVKENPRREGTKGHKRFAHYLAGAKTISDYVAKVVNRGRAMADIKWDLAHGFIKLSP